MDFTENKNFISFKNLLLSDDLKILSADNVDVNFVNDNGIKNNFNIIKEFKQIYFSRKSHRWRKNN